MRIAIVGAGIAGTAAAAELVAQRFTGEVSVFEGRRRLPFRDPAGAGTWLDLGEVPVAAHDEAWFARHGVRLHLEEEVLGIDTGARRLATRRGYHHFDRLLLATGTTVQRLGLPGADGTAVEYADSMHHARRLGRTCAPGGEVVVLGAGWLGLEVAASARTAGARVTVVDVPHVASGRVLTGPIGRILRRLHRDKGVRLRLDAHAVAVEDTRADRAVVVLSDGGRLTADRVVVAIAPLAEDSLAGGAGLRTDDGILVDSGLRASQPGVFAAGGAARQEHPALDGHLRLERPDAAVAQAGVAVRNMLGGTEISDPLPYFLSDQYHLCIEHLGGPTIDGDRCVLHRRADEGVYTAFWLRRGRVVAALHANDWNALEVLRALVGQQIEAAQPQQKRRRSAEPDGALLVGPTRSRASALSIE